jgi:ribosomal-protein-alanine N-acetyltransferase
MIISPATEMDLEAIDAIEVLSFPTPWPMVTFAGELEREWARIDVGRVATADGMTIVAFNNYWLVTTELHVLHIATHPDHRGRGYGMQLLAHSIEAAIATGASLATLEVRRSNLAAISLYERSGFKTVHVRPRYYQDDGEDALVMLRGLSE